MAGTGMIPARDIDARVVEEEGGIKAVYVVDAETGEKLEPLLEGQSLEYRVEFSPGKKWLLIEDRVVEDLTTVRLFHHEGVGGYRRVPDEMLTVPIWRTFYETYEMEDVDILSSSVTLLEWDEERDGMTLRFEVEHRDGRNPIHAYDVDLTLLR